MCVSMTDPGSPKTAWEHLGPAEQLQGLGVVRSVCTHQKHMPPTNMKRNITSMQITLKLCLKRWGE